MSLSLLLLILIFQINFGRIFSKVSSFPMMKMVSPLGKQWMRWKEDFSRTTSSCSLWRLGVLGNSFPQIGLPLTNCSLVSLLLIKDCLHCKLFFYQLIFFSHINLNESMDDFLSQSIPPFHEKDVPSPPITPSNRNSFFIYLFYSN